MSSLDTLEEHSERPWLSFSRQPIVRIVAGEILRCVLLLIAMCLAVGALIQFAFQENLVEHGFWVGLLDFLKHVHLNKDGVPFLEFFLQAALHTLKLSGSALLLVGLGTMIFGSLLAYFPRMGILKMVLLGISAVPSFMWPFVIYLMLPDLPFQGFSSHVLFLWPALALAVGDLNLVTVSNTYAETLRHEMSRPHVRTIHALRRRAWLELWPRSMVAIVGALGARIPHLLGGTIALEVLYDIHGIGFLAWKSIMDVPPDYNAILWVCGLGICVSCLIDMLQRLLTIKLLPETVDRFEGAKSPRGAENDVVTLGRLSQDSLHFHSASGARQPDRPPSIPQFLSRSTNPIGIIPWRPWFHRIRYYLYLNSSNVAKLLAALLICATFLSALTCCLVVYSQWHPEGPQLQYEQFAKPASSLLFGANAAGENVMLELSRGLFQQVLPLLSSVSIACSAAVLAALISVSGNFHFSNRWGWCARLARFCFDSVAEFIESFPKIVILLACVSFFSSTNLLWKLYISIGILFIPQVYRAVRDDLAVLNRSQFIEALLLGGVSQRKILFHNILRNHCLHTVAIQTALLAGCIIQVDAMLGFLGIRSRGEIFTWGALLGTGIEEFMLFRPLGQFNDGVVWGPALAVWLMIVTMFTLADALKIPFGGYVYRLK